MKLVYYLIGLLVILTAESEDADEYALLSDGSIICKLITVFEVWGHVEPMHTKYQ